MGRNDTQPWGAKDAPQTQKYMCDRYTYSIEHSAECFQEPVGLK